MAEGVGFEPTELSLNGFQDRRLKPLGHPSCKNGLVFSIKDLPGQSFYTNLKGCKSELTLEAIND
jgi:hypothetical protein